jgi:hypothetical protein
MKIQCKLKVIFLIFAIIFTSQAIAADKILPVPKPIPDKETKIKTAQKKIIYPEVKPTLKKEKVEITESQEISEINDEVKKKEVFIYPEKKPTIVQKKIDKRVTKSKILSKKDFSIAKAALLAVDKKKWQTAIKLSKKANTQI